MARRPRPQEIAPPLSSSTTSAGGAADAGLSLDALSEAFAGMLQAAEPYAPPPLRTTAGTDDAEPPPSADDDGEVSPRSIVEAMLFVGLPDGRPLTARQMAALMRGVRPAEVDELVRELREQYVANNCPYEIASVAEGYRMQLRSEYSRIRDKLQGRTRQARLSAAAIEVLSLAAYKGPLTADEVSNLRGSASGHLLAQLVRRRLLAIDRRGNKPRYTVTQRFLDLFGLDSLQDLPQPDGPSAAAP
ncbi:MAG: SMC-Scp complex subunit ScpB [Pirellulales bacterium]|nr:SMC-Scp complex subunit ScpB [Pirellulales bacterium]